jgi:hypothetical protein
MEKSFFAKILYNYPVLFVRDIPAFALARLAIGIAFIAGEQKKYLISRSQYVKELWNGIAEKPPQR